tara:strand:+ start:490 stop:720 length:231 start_codon:yes stop_codon:yes gene_type:complete
MIKKALEKLGIGKKKKKKEYSPADVPLGDGFINREKVKIQSRRMRELDMMLREGFITKEQYEKDKFRIMGTKKKKK